MKNHAIKNATRPNVRSIPADLIIPIGFVKACPRHRGPGPDDLAGDDDDGGDVDGGIGGGRNPVKLKKE